jgi:predicted dehydrogenase
MGRAHPGRHAVIFQWRCHPATAAARDLVVGGRIGSIVVADLTFHHDFLAGPSTDCQWRHDAATAGAGTLADQAVHMFDLLPWLTGKQWAIDSAAAAVAFPSRTSGAGDTVAGETDDIAMAHLREVGGAGLARVLTSRISTGLRQWKAVLTGTAGTVTVVADPDDGSARLTISGGSDRVRDFGPESMNPYVQLLGGPAGTLRGPSFEDGLAAQQLLHAAQSAASVTGSRPPVAAVRQ